MANIIQLKRSSVAGKRPDAVDLQVGEIAVNLADGILYSKNTAGYVVVVGSAKTSNVIEDGNLYFTTARARSSISAGDSSIIYDSVNGTIRANVAALGGANVISVNGFDGIVVLDTDDISEGSANLYYTDERVYSNVVLLDYATNTLVGALYDQSNTNATVIGLAFDEANAASGTAGVVFDQSNTNITIIGLAFDQANTATTYALSAYDQANTVFDTVNALTTTEVTEGDNLYFTNTRAISAFTPGTGINIDANGLILSTVTGGEGGSGGGNVTVSSSPPVSPVQGDVWIDAETGAYLTYFSDGDSNQWAEVASSIVFGGQGGGVADLTSNIIIGTDGDPTNVIIHSTITGNLTPSDNEVYDLGSSELKWKDLYLSGNTINLGNATISASGDAIVLPENTTVGSAAIATPRISSIDYPGDDTAADPNGNQIISIIGSGFASGASVVIDGTTVGVVSFISSTELQIISPAKAAGSYTLYVINPDGGTGIFIPGFQYSGTPTWNTSAGSLGSVYETGSISETLNATSDGTVTYSLLSGTLPAGSTLDANAGTITGTASNVDSPTTYNFTIRATDEENQDTDRAFSLTIDPDAISWVTPTNGSVVTLEVDAASNTNLLATSLANDTITYSANSLPVGLTLTGNVVSGTPNTLGNVYTTLTASGDNTNKSNVITITWTIEVGVDPLFNQTTLLLNGDGTNGAQNNTFLDSSSNNHSITRNGSSTQGTFSPFTQPDGKWSVYFDGNGDQLTKPATSDYSFSSGDWTFETWIYLNVLKNGQNLMSVGTGGEAITASFAATSTGALSAGFGTQLWGWASTNTSTTGHIQAHKWHHVAYVKSGSSLLMFVDGVSVFNSTPSFGSGVSGTVWIGSYFNNHNNDGSWFDGYMSNHRLVKGTALYTSNFTPPTEPLTNITNTKHLICQSNRFIDKSPNSFVFAQVGNVKITSLSPFAPEASYDPAVNGGSSYSMSLDAPASIGTALGTGTWTIGCWVYITTDIQGGFIFDSSYSNSTSRMGIGDGTNKRPTLQIYQSGSNRVLYYGSNNSLVWGQWNYVALCHTGSGNYQFYVNGVAQTASGATGYYWNSSILSAAKTAVGYSAYGGASGNYNGYVSDFVVKTGVDGSIPTSPRTSDANASLLLNFTNAGIKDLAGKNNIETVGNAQISTSVKKYGSGSLSFDGTGDYLLQTSNSDNYTFGTGDFTVEFWLYLNSVAVDQIIFDTRPASTQGVYPTLYFADSGDTLNWFVSGLNRITSSALVTGTWYHIAVVRSSGSTKMYLDGSQTGSTYSDTNNYLSSRLVIGAQSFTLGDGPLNGYVDDLRITKGVARYTSNFTPPTSAFATK